MTQLRNARQERAAAGAPWTVAGLVVALVGSAVLLGPLLRGDDGRVAAGDPPVGLSSSAFNGSDQVALRFVEALAAEDHERAFDLACGELQAALGERSDGSGVPTPDVLAAAVADSLGGHPVAAITVDAVGHDASHGFDLVELTVLLDDGDTTTISLGVAPDATVCTF
jgi:hypothetical protein